MYFGDYLKQCREHTDLTQEQLVYNLYSFDTDTFEGVNMSAISKWEHRKVNPPLARKLAIIKFFQHRTKSALPCWEGHSIEEAQTLLCKVGMQNLIGHGRQLVLNFPTEVMGLDDFRIYPLRESEHLDRYVDIAMSMHLPTNPPPLQVSAEQFKEWSIHPGNLFLVCEYKEVFTGYLFALKLKQEIFEKIVDFTLHKSEITPSDFAAPNEPGSVMPLSLFSLNNKAATMLFIRYYAYLIANQNTIADIGGVTALDETERIVTRMNMQHQDTFVTRMV